MTCRSSISLHPKGAPVECALMSVDGIPVHCCHVQKTKTMRALRHGKCLQEHSDRNKVLGVVRSQMALV